MLRAVAMLVVDTGEYVKPFGETGRGAVLECDWGGAVGGRAVVARQRRGAMQGLALLRSPPLVVDLR